MRLFGGTSTEKILTNTCRAADHDPNLLLFCDGSKNGIPWVTNLKLSGVYPLPRYGVSVSGALQALAGQPLGLAPLQYGVFTAGTGFDRPNGLGTYWLVTPTLNYPANCKGNCTPGARVVPGLTTSSALIPLIAPGTEFTPRTNQVDFGASKTVRVGQFSFTPKVDVFNAFNSDDYTAVVTSSNGMPYGTLSYLQPSVILQGRLIRIGADVKW